MPLLSFGWSNKTDKVPSPRYIWKMIEEGDLGLLPLRSLLCCLLKQVSYLLPQPLAAVTMLF